MKVKAVGLAWLMFASVVVSVAFGTASAQALPICSPTPDGFIPWIMNQCAIPMPNYPHTNYPDGVMYSDYETCEAIARSYRQTPGVYANCFQPGPSGRYKLSVDQH